MSLTPNDIRELNAFVDGELELSKQLELEARLAVDIPLRDEFERLRALRGVLHERADYHAAPDALRSRLGLLPAASPRPAEPTRLGDLRQWLGWRPLVAGLTFAVLAISVFDALRPGLDTDDRLMQEVIASHVRSTVGQRLVDVASSDQHTVKPWLSSRLDYSPPVANAPVPEAVFVGGRVDYLDGRPVAALVYRQRQHVIDAYVWPSSRNEAVPEALSQRGFNIVHWARGGMRFWLVSDLNRNELDVFARALDLASAAR